MRERCLQSLAILLAGLFSAERSPKRVRVELAAQASESPEQHELAARDTKWEH